MPRFRIGLPGPFSVSFGGSRGPRSRTMTKKQSEDTVRGVSVVFGVVFALFALPFLFFGAAAYVIAWPCLWVANFFWLGMKDAFNSAK